MLSWNEVQCKAASIGVTNPSPDRYELIRQIQTAEGYAVCFKTKTACSEMQCCWRSECLGRRTTCRMPVVKNSGNQPAA